MVEQAGLGPDAEHVVVEGPGLDGRGVLAQIDRAMRAMASRDGLERLQGLAGRELAGPGLVGAAAIDEQVHPRRAMLGAETNVVGRALVAEVRLGRQGVVDGEAALVGEGAAQVLAGLPVLQAAVQVGDQVGGAEVHPPVAAVGRRGDGGRIGRPHGRSRPSGAGDGGRGLPGGLVHLSVRAGEAQAAQESEVGATVRRQHELGHAQVGQQLHLAETLQHRRARIGGRAEVGLAGQVARRQAGVVVGRPDQAVEVGFDRAHAFRPLISAVVDRARSASKLATG